MPDDIPQDPAVEQEQDPTPDASATDDLGDAGKKALDAERSRAKEAEKRAKQLERELEQARTASLSDAEKAVKEAELRGAQQATERWAQRLVRSDFVAAASRRNPDYDASSVLDDLNLARFIGEDGEPDTDAIAAAVNRLVPAAGPRRPTGDVGQGPRDIPEAPSDPASLADAVVARRGH